MIFATLDGQTTIVAAASSLTELEIFFTNINLSPPEFFISFEQPDIGDMLLDDRLFKMKHPPYIFQHDNVEQANSFAEKHGISIVSNTVLVDKNHVMMKDARKDATKDAFSDPRTIAEMYDLKENDKWDTRTPEQIQHSKDLMEKSKKAGSLTDESFVPPAPGTTITNVTEVDITTNNDGTYSIDRVSAVKGVYEPTDDEPTDEDEEIDICVYRVIVEKEKKTILENASRLLQLSFGDWISNDAETFIEFNYYQERYMARLCIYLDNCGVEFQHVKIANGITEEYSCNDDAANEIDILENIAIYYRVDIKENVDTVMSVIPKDVKLFAIVENRGIGNGSWVAVISRSIAETVSALFHPEKIEDVYEVNDGGVRILEKNSGAKILHEEEENNILPRIWNELSHKIDEMTDEEKAANKKTIKAKEFLYCGRFMGSHEGCIVYICPKSYFANHGEMFDKPLDIDNILPPNFKEIEPGVYHSKFDHWTTLSPLLAHKGFQESLMMQLYLNNL